MIELPFGCAAYFSFHQGEEGIPIIRAHAPSLIIPGEGDNAALEIPLPHHQDLFAMQGENYRQVIEDMLFLGEIRQESLEKMDSASIEMFRHIERDAMRFYAGCN